MLRKILLFPKLTLVALIFLYNIVPVNASWGSCTGDYDRREEKGPGVYCMSSPPACKAGYQITSTIECPMKGSGYGPSHYVVGAAGGGGGGGGGGDVLDFTNN